MPKSFPLDLNAGFNNYIKRDYRPDRLDGILDALCRLHQENPTSYNALQPHIVA